MPAGPSWYDGPGWAERGEMRRPTDVADGIAGDRPVSVLERALLRDEISQSLVDDPDDLPLTEAQKADLQRRLDAYRDDPEAGTPWEIVKADALARFSR